MRTYLMVFAAALTALLIAGGSALAADNTPDPLAPASLRAELDRARTAIAAAEYEEAITRLQAIVATNPRNADAYSLLGFSYRKVKDYGRSERNYRRALRLDPDHKGALEYIGELYLETDRRAQAEKMLARLERLCPNGCEELTDLRKAFAGAQTTSSSW